MQADVFFQAFTKAHSYITKSIDGMLSAYGLSYARWQMMQKILENGEKARPSYIARELGLTKATITCVVDGLEKAGLAGRRPCDKDGRQTCIFLTDKGSILARKVEPLVQQHMQALFQSVQQPDMDSAYQLFDILQLSPTPDKE